MRAAVSTVVGLIAISGLAFTLIGIVIARSPYTHGNLSAQGYHRTELSIVGQEYNFDGLGLADPQLAQTGDPVEDGRALFFQYGCASCHGFQGEGATVGVDLDEASASEIRRKVREGPEGMPAYAASFLSDEDLETIVEFLKAAFAGQSEQTGIGTWDGPSDALQRPAARGGSLLGEISTMLARVLDRAMTESGETTKWRFP